MTANLTKREPDPLDVLGFEITDRRPDYIPEGDSTGAEGITAQDIERPRLSIAQGLSPQMTPGDSAYVDGLGMFDFFNSANGEVYGKGPLYFVVVKHEKRRIEFRPRAEGGGVVDMDVPLNDPRLNWTTGEDGKSIPPRATTFSEFVVLLLRPGGKTEPIVLSIAHRNKFNSRAAMRLYGFIRMHATQGKASVPIFDVVYSVTSKPEKNDKGTFGTPVIEQVGFYNSPQLSALAREMHEALRDKAIVTSREPGDDDFVPATIEAEM